MLLHRGNQGNWRWLLLGGLLLLVVLAGLPDIAHGGVPDATATAAKPLPAMPDYVPGEVIVLLSEDDNRARGSEPLRGIEDALRGQVVRRSRMSRGKEAVKVKLPPGKTVAMALAEDWSKADSRIVAVEPNYRVRALLTPNDPLYPQMWGLNNTGQAGGTVDADIDAPEAWNVTTGSSSVIVCVIDSGVDYMHPDLAPNMWQNPGEIAGNGIDDDGNGYVDDIYGWDFYQNDKDPSDAAGHGTHVAGTIAARGNNGLGVTGVSWQCKIMACRFLGADGYGDTYDAVDCINYAVANGARILNNSWGGGGYSAVLEAAIVNARNNGVLFVAAAGNSGTDNDVLPHYPSSYAVDNIIAVANTTHTDGLSSSSCYGTTSVHMGAPGTSILSSVPPLVALFMEDFQGATVPGFAGTQMTLQGSANRWGTVNDAVTAGNKAARGDLVSSPYQGGSDGAIVTPVLNTTGLRGLSVFFRVRIDCGPGDTLSVDVTNNGITWTTLALLSDTAGFFPSDTYYYVLVDVPQNLQGSTTRFRWRWTTNSADNDYIGVEIDDIVVQCIGSNYSSAYSAYSGTSMATPHVSGVAALMLASNPTLTYAQLKNKLVWFGDPIPALAGKTISGRRLNANTALRPVPPVALDISASTAANTSTLVTLDAKDDGLPASPGAVTYIITSLPAHGSLADPNGSAITAVPYSLLSHGKQVLYTPASGYDGSDGFTYKASDGGTPPSGGDSNIAAVSIEVYSLIYAANMNSNPGWTLGTGWAWGTPTGNGSVYGLDPTSGHTGSNVIGYNLNGAYENNMSVARYATTPAVNCTGYRNIRLRFWRWLGVEMSTYDHAAILVSTDGVTWTEVWNHSGNTINDASWTRVDYALPSSVENQPTVYIRWAMGPTDSSVTYQGWNIDDVEVIGNQGALTPFYTENLDSDPGWSKTGQWAFGVPQGQGGALYGCPDPTGGATGMNVYGVNLAGDYGIGIGGPYYLTTNAINCTGQEEVHLAFKRWLNTDWGDYVGATVEVSNNGSTWTTIYANEAEEEVTDCDWQSVSYDISAVADNRPTVYVRWGYQVKQGGAYAYSGWNIDDIVLSGISAGCTAPATPANPDPADGAIDVPSTSVLSWNGTGGYIETFNDGLAQGWQETTDAQWSVVDGEYRAQAGALNTWMQSLYTGQTVRDCYVQATLRRTGDIYVVSGLVVRASADFSCGMQRGSAYLLGTTGSGDFYVVKFVAGNVFWLQSWTHSNLLAEGLADNTVGLSIQGSSIKVYFNGSLAWSGTDSDVAGPGYVGLYNYTQDDPSTAHYYDNVLIGQPLDVELAMPAVQAWYNTHTVAGSLDRAPATAMPLPPADLLAAGKPKVYSTAVGVKQDEPPQATSGQAPTGTGGPDAGGYVFIDSDTPGGPAFNWIDIRYTGTHMPLSDESYYFPINLPFVFDFYGTGYNQLAVSSNGAIYFDATLFPYINTPIPGNSGSSVNKYIAVYWDDLDPSVFGGVYYQVLGTAPHRVLVVQWEAVSHFGSSTDTVTMQAQLYEGSGHILLLYADPSSEAGSGATVGIQRDPATGLQYLYNQPVLHAGLAVLLTRGVTYDLYLWSGDAAGKPATPTASCLLTPYYDAGHMQCNETNYWCVVAKGPCGQTLGPTWSFNVFRRPGDANGDGYVDVVDLLSLVYSYGLCAGDEGYDPTCDFYPDDCIDVADLLTLVFNFGQ